MGLVVNGNNGEVMTHCPQMINDPWNDLIGQELFVSLFALQTGKIHIGCPKD